MVGPHSAREIAMFDNRTDPRYPRHPGELRDMADLRRMIDGYDCGIRYMDEHIGRMLAALERQGVLDDLAIIVSSDHGENLGELGIYGEHATADHVTCRIPHDRPLARPARRTGGPRPALQPGPGPHPGRTDRARALAALGRESFAPALRGADCGRPDLVLSQCAHVCQRSVRWGDWLYMRTYHDGYHLFPQEMLFDVAAGSRTSSTTWPRSSPRCATKALTACSHGTMPRCIRCRRTLPCRAMWIPCGR